LQNIHLTDRRGNNEEAGKKDGGDSWRQRFGEFFECERIYHGSFGGYRIVAGAELDPSRYYAPPPRLKKKGYPVEVHWYKRVPEYETIVKLQRIS